MSAPDGMEAFRDGFREEARDRLDDLAAALSGMARNEADAVDAAFAAVHTIKGGALAVGLADLGATADTMEETLAALRADAAPVPQKVQADLRAGHDRLRTALGGGGDAPAPGGEAAAPPAAYRVRRERADRLADLAIELGMAEAALRAALPSSGAADRATTAAHRLSRTSSRVRRAALGLRVQPLGPLLEDMAAMGRDVARRLGKRLEVEIEGADVEIDVAIATRLSGPLTHLVRNAVDHGIEDDRTAAGKAEAGLVRLVARREGDFVALEVSDDGGGVDASALRRRADLSEVAATGAPDTGDDLLALAARPGLSTREVATDISGRGVGLDAVLRETTAFGARMDLSSAPGTGTCFRLVLPTTTSVMECLHCIVGGVRIALPAVAVRATRVRPPAPDGLLELAAWVAPGPAAPGAEVVDLAAPSHGALAVERVLTLAETAILPIPAAAASKWVTGTLLGEDGCVGLVIDPHAAVEACA